MRHVIEDPVTLLQVMQTRIRSSLSARLRSNRAVQQSKFLDEFAPIILRNPEVFKEAISSVCYVDPRLSGIQLKQESKDSKDTPPDSIECESIFNALILSLSRDRIPHPGNQKFLLLSNSNILQCLSDFSASFAPFRKLLLHTQAIGMVITQYASNSDKNKTPAASLAALLSSLCSDDSGRELVSKELSRAFENEISKLKIKDDPAAIKALSEIVHSLLGSSEASIAPLVQLLSADQLIHHLISAINNTQFARTDGFSVLSTITKVDCLFLVFNIEKKALELLLRLVCLKSDQRQQLQPEIPEIPFTGFSFLSSEAEPAVQSIQTPESEWFDIPSLPEDPAPAAVVSATDEMELEHEEPAVENEVSGNVEVRALESDLGENTDENDVASDSQDSAISAEEDEEEEEEEDEDESSSAASDEEQAAHSVNHSILRRLGLRVRRAAEGASFFSLDAVQPFSLDTSGNRIKMCC